MLVSNTRLKKIFNINKKDYMLYFILKKTKIKNKQILN